MYCRAEHPFRQPAQQTQISAVLGQISGYTQMQLLQHPSASQWQDVVRFFQLTVQQTKQHAKAWLGLAWLGSECWRRAGEH